MSTERAVLVAQLAKEFVADRLVSSYYALPMAERILNLPTVARLLRAEESEEELLRRFGAHHDDCYWLSDEDHSKGCNCGWAKVAPTVGRDPESTMPDRTAPGDALRRAAAVMDAWLRDSRLRGRVAREVACAAGLRPDDPPLPEHLDAAREIIRLVRAAPAALQGEQLHHPRSVAHEYEGDANHEVLSYLEVKLQIAEDANIDRVTVAVDNLRDMIAALRSTEPGGERVPRPKNS
ncbi:MAG TPA: hypothetical protein VFI96_06235 [Longimicrobiaceae bacterium]|nr:hypothetical protein [Longimicrobiaceae bacterium]